MRTPQIRCVDFERSRCACWAWRKSTGFGRGRRALGVWRIARLRRPSTAGHGPLLASGRGERPQHIPVLLAPDPQGTTSFARVGVVASSGEKAAARRRQDAATHRPHHRQQSIAPSPVGARLAGDKGAGIMKHRPCRRCRVARKTGSYNTGTPVGVERSHAPKAPKDAAVRGYGASSTRMCCARLSEAGRRSQPMRHTPALPRLPPKPTPPDALAPEVAVAVAVAVFRAARIRSGPVTTPGRNPGSTPASVRPGPRPRPCAGRNRRPGPCRRGRPRSTGSADG